MKKCKLFSTAQKKETDAVIIDKRVLVPAPRHEIIMPSYEADGICYYPPRDVVSYANGLYWMPFSVQCEWGEYGEYDDCWYDCSEERLKPPDDDDSRPMWAIYHGIDAPEEKWGYCHASTGKIMVTPQWERCEDFNDDCYAVVKGGKIGVVCDGGEVIIWPEYDEIRLEPGSVALVRQHGKWGAYSLDAYYERHPNDISCEWDGIWRGGPGGYTVMRRNMDGRERYGILNSSRDVVVENLSAMPERYQSKRENTLRDFWDSGGFRIIKRGSRYGLVCDDDGRSKLLLEPKYSRKRVMAELHMEEIEEEVRYYAIVISRTPRHSQTSDGDGWENVPEDIVDKVRAYMKENDMTQPETARDL